MITEHFIYVAEPIDFIGKRQIGQNTCFSSVLSNKNSSLMASAEGGIIKQLNEQKFTD